MPASFFGGFMNVKRQFSVIGWALSAFYLVSAGIQLLFGVILEKFGHIFPEQVWSDDFLMILSLAVMYGIAFPVFWLIIRRLPSWFKEEKQTIHAGKLIVIFIICLGAAYIGNLIGNVLMLFGNLLFGIRSINPVTDTFLNMTPGVMMVSTVVVAPVMEELIFRKLLIDRLIPCGQKTAVLVSGLTFALFHGNFYQFFYACSLGMIFAYLYSHTGKLRYSIIMHMGINFMGGILPLLLERWVGGRLLLSWIVSLLLGGFSVLMMLLSMILSIVFAGRVTWFSAWEKPDKGMAHAVFTASGVWIFLLLCAGEFAQMC